MNKYASLAYKDMQDNKPEEFIALKARAQQQDGKKVAKKGTNSATRCRGANKLFSELDLKVRSFLQIVTRGKGLDC